MPLPLPKSGEKEDVFIPRCMGNETMKSEFPDRKQRTAVCYSRWRKKHSGSAPPPSKSHAGSVGMIRCDAKPVEIQAAEAEDKPATFAITAYTGGALKVPGYQSPVVLDLAGIEAEGEQIPSYLGHDSGRIVGHGSPEITPQRIKLKGVVSGGGDAADEVRVSARLGFPWKASVGVNPRKIEYVEAEATANANGRAWKGPLHIVRNGVLAEVSFVPRGADRNTTVNVAAEENRHMDDQLKTWLEAKEFDPETLSEEQVTTLKASYDAIHNPTLEPGAADAAHGEGGEPAKPEKPVQAEAEADFLKAQAEQTRRIAAIRKLCDGKHPEIEAKAIEEGWNLEKAEVAVLRAERPKAPAAHTSQPAVTAAAMEAALCRTAGLRDIEKQFDEKTLEAADKHFRHDLGLQEMLVIQAQQNGWQGRRFRSDASTMREILAAGFSGHDLAGSILSNTANKFLLQSFNAVESAWREITAIGSVKDFKTVTRYRLTGDATYEELSPEGYIPHGTLDALEYTIAADTYARMYAITRKDLINDDLGVFARLGQRLGRGAALKINKVFWTLFINNSTFFTTARANYLAGATYALTAADPIAALAMGLQMFRDQTDPDGDPLGVEPALLLVPTALEAHALELYDSTKITSAVTQKRQPTNNVFARRFRPVVSAYLGNALYTGYSTKAWYMLADPADLAVIETAFLNGKQTPTVESADADFNVLGVEFRGYHDFGVAMMEYRGGVKLKGET